MAVSMTLMLERKTLTNVDDPAGRWQHEGGTAKRGKTVVANYATTRRVTNGGTDAQNTAMLTTLSSPARTRRRTSPFTALTTSTAAIRSAASARRRAPNPNSGRAPSSTPAVPARWSSRRPEMGRARDDESGELC